MNLWCHRRLIFSLPGPTAGREIVVERPYAMIGSHPQADVHLDEEQFPPRAAYVHATAEGIYYRLLDASFNQPEVAEFLPLSVTGELSLGSLVIRVQAESIASADPLDSADDEPIIPRTPVLYLESMNAVSGGEKPISRRLHFPLQIVGSDPHCEIELRSQTVAPYHCVLFWQRNRLWCIDLQSELGVQLEGERIRCGEVKLGNRLEIGDYRVRFERFSSRVLATGSSSDSVEVAKEKPANASPAKATSKPIAPTLIDARPTSAGHPVEQPSVVYSVAETVLKPELATLPFNAIDVQYSLPAESLVQWDTTSLFERLQTHEARWADEFAALKGKWESSDSEVRQLRLRLQEELARSAALRAELERQQAERGAQQDQAVQLVASLRSELQRETTIAKQLQVELLERSRQLSASEAEFAARAEKMTREQELLSRELREEIAAARSAREQLQAELQQATDHHATQGEQWEKLGLEVQSLLATSSQTGAALQQQATDFTTWRAAQQQQWESLVDQMEQLRNEQASRLHTVVAELVQLRDQHASEQESRRQAFVATRNDWATLQASLAQALVDLRDRDQELQALGLASEKTRAENTQELERLRTNLADFTVRREELAREATTSLEQSQAEFLQLKQSMKRYLQTATKEDERRRQEQEQALAKWPRALAAVEELRSQLVADLGQLTSAQGTLATHAESHQTLAQKVADDEAAVNELRTEMTSRLNALGVDLASFRAVLEERLTTFEKTPVAAISDEQVDQLRQQFEDQSRALADQFEELRRNVEQSNQGRDNVAQYLATLANGFSLLGQQLRGERVAMESELSLPNLEPLENEADIRRELATIKQQLHEQQLTTDHLQEAQMKELRKLAKERTATKYQWAQLSKSFTNVTNQYRKQAKLLAEERQRMTEEHDKIMADKLAAFDKFSVQTMELESLYRQLLQSKEEQDRANDDQGPLAAYSSPFTP